MKTFTVVQCSDVRGRTFITFEAAEAVVMNEGMLVFKDTTGAVIRGFAEGCWSEFYVEDQE